MLKAVMLAISGMIFWQAGLVTPAIAAPSITVHVQSGQVTQAEDAFRRWSPASLTKLMTAYVTFRALRNESLELSSPVKISGNAANTPPSRMGYAVGSVLTVDNALKMLIIKSANDIAVALGEAVAGSEPAFVQLMNEVAVGLGMTGTSFVNPHGLHDVNQYTTARDMALLSRAIRLEFPEFDRLFAAEAIRVGDAVTPTYNLLLGRYDGADGMKTGFVCASGFNIVASATRNNDTVITVVMGEPSQKARGEKSARLMDDAFLKVASGADLPDLTSLPVNQSQASQPMANLRPQVCTEQARASRWDGRQIEGFLTFDTPSITALQRPPVAISAGLGGAEGQSASAVIMNGTVISGYPIPERKPFRPTLLEEGDSERFGLRPGFNAPVPTTRPTNLNAG